VAERSKTPGWESRSKVVGSIPRHASNSSTPEINKAASVRVIMVSADSGKDVYHEKFIA